MKILIQTLTNKKIEIFVNSNDKVKTIKDKIQEKEGIPPDQQALVFGGNRLGDDNFISDYNITDNSKVHLVLRLRGGHSIKDEPINIFRQEKNQLDNKQFGLQLKEASKEEEIIGKYYFQFCIEEKDYFFSYDGNLTIKEMLTDFLNKINSKEIPENKYFMYKSHTLNNYFSKKIKEIFTKRERIYHNIIKILDKNDVIGGNK